MSQYGTACQVGSTRRRATASWPQQRVVLRKCSRTASATLASSRCVWRGPLLQPSVTLDAQATVRDAITAMRQEQTSCVLIVDQRQLVGVFTERDVVTTIAAQEIDLDRLPVGAVMRPEPDCLEMDDELVYALHHMSVGEYRHIPVVDARRQPPAVVSMQAIMGYIVESFPQEILNLPPSPAHNIAPTPEGA
jgi:CBS domain-containing protein